MPWSSTKLVLGFVFSHGSGALKSFRLSLPQTLVMYSPGKGSGKLQESASGNMEGGMAGQATGSCQGQQGTGSGSNTLDPWGDYLQRQQFVVQQTLNQVGGPRIPSTPTNGSRGEVVPLILIKVVFGIRACRVLVFNSCRVLVWNRCLRDLETAWIILLQLGEFFSK